MALKLIIPPAEPVVTLEEAKAHLRVETADQDTLIEFLVSAATAHIDGKDGWLNRALKPQTYDLLYDAFPSGPIAIPMRPLIDVVSVKYDDEDGVEQTVDPDDYVVDTASDPGWVVPISEFSWPSTINAINAVRVRFTAGYEDSLSSGSGGDENMVPAPIRAAILLMVGDLYEFRESVVQGTTVATVDMPTTVKELLKPFRVFV